MILPFWNPAYESNVISYFGCFFKFDFNPDRQIQLKISIFLAAMTALCVNMSVYWSVNSEFQEVCTNDIRFKVSRIEFV